MPRLWLDYCQFLMEQGKITRTRRAFDRALRALPVTQHHRVWPLYLKFVGKYDLPEMALRVHRRHMQVFSSRHRDDDDDSLYVMADPHTDRLVQLQPELAEDFIAYLIKTDHLDEAAVRLAGLINDEAFVSKEGKSKHQVRLYKTRGLALFYLPGLFSSKKADMFVLLDSAVSVVCLRYPAPVSMEALLISLLTAGQ